MNFPENYLYSKSHEWVKDLGGGLFEIGLTDYAQHELGDLVFVNLPKPGDAVKAEKPFADVESVKAVSDIFSPLDGTVAEVNEALLDSPELINKAPNESWLVKVKGSLPAGGLLSAADYQATLPKE